MSTLTFARPPVDGSLSIPQIYDFHLEHSPDYPLFRYHDSKSRTDLTWRTVVHSIHHAAIKVTAAIPIPSVVGILAVADSLTYITTLFGIMRAGHIPFPISTRNSPAAVRHLLAATSTRYLFVSRDAAMSALADAALPDATVTLLPMFTLEDLYPAQGQLLPPMRTPDMSAPSIILHSSGTTAFPKPITYSHSDLLQFARLPLTGEMAVPGQVHAMHAIPMFHAMGVTSLGRAAVAAMIISIFEPQWPPLAPSPDRLLRAIVVDGCTIAPCVPSFLETWSTDPEAITILARCKAVIFAGGPLSQSVGDFLVQSGVRLYSVYGGTEVGTISMMVPEKSLGLDWQYFRFAPYFSPHLVPCPWAPPGVFELYALDTEEYTPIVHNAYVEVSAGEGEGDARRNYTIGKQRAYATKDLVVRHPTKKELWRVYGRADDQIMLSTGEKTNPGPIEDIFYTDPRIASAVMFGRGEPHNGILLELVPESRFDVADTRALAAFRQSVWYLVERANAVAPAHSRLYQEMVLVADPTSTFEYTLKGAPRRYSVLAAHVSAIAAAYAAFSHAPSLATVPAPPPLVEVSSTNADEDADVGESQMLGWIRKVLGSVLELRVEDVPEHGDVFALGCDSLQAIRIRNVITSALSHSPHAGVDADSDAHTRTHGTVFDASKLPPDFVYKHPAPVDMARTLVAIMRVGVSGGDEHKNGPNKANESQESNSQGQELREGPDASSEHVSTPPVGTNPSVRSGATNPRLKLKLQKMEDLVAEMTAGVRVGPHTGTGTGTGIPTFDVEPAPVMTSTPERSDVVLVTGTTGALGSHLLARLAACPGVARVFALNRRRAGRGLELVQMQVHNDNINPGVDATRGDLDLEDVRRRQGAAFALRGIDADSVCLWDESPTRKVTVEAKGKVVMLVGDVNRPGWGIGPDVFEDLRRSVTLIIHVAWPVDFNYTLASYRPAIEGVRNLVQFAQSSTLPTPPHIIFTSSISVLRNWSSDDPVPEAPLPDPAVAVGLGYAEAKWVAERVLDRAAALDPRLRASVVRVGQLSGSPNGVWNASEWFPSIVLSARALGALPKLEMGLSWLPVDTAAAAIVDMRHTEERYIHLAHPTAVPALSVLRPIATALDVPLIPFDEWRTRLVEYARDTSPTARITMMVQFFEESQQDVLREQRLSLVHALASSPVLAHPALPVVGTEDVEKWLTYWGV